MTTLPNVSQRSLVSPSPTPFSQSSPSPTNGGGLASTDAGRLALEEYRKRDGSKGAINLSSFLCAAEALS